MRVTTKKVMQWDKEAQAYVTLEHESHEHDGPVAEMKGGSSAPSTTTSTTKPFPEQLPFVKRVFGEAQSLFDRGPMQFFPGQTVANESANTIAARDMQAQIANQLGGFIGQGNQALLGLLGPLDPANDPTVVNFANAATQPLIDQFNQQILPGIGSSANAAGAFGGSRQGLVEAAAGKGLADSVGQTRAGIFNDAFGKQLQAQQNALSMFPQFAGLQALPAQLLSEVGAQEQSRNQALIDAARERFEFQQMAPLMNLQNFSNLINQFGGGQTIQTGLGGSSPSRFSSALGGAALGASIPGFGIPGAIGGGLLGLAGIL